MLGIGDRELFDGDLDVGFGIGRRNNTQLFRLGTFNAADAPLRLGYSVTLRHGGNIVPGGNAENPVMTSQKVMAGQLLEPELGFKFVGHCPQVRKACGNNLPEPLAFERDAKLWQPPFVVLAQGCAREA